MSATTRCCWCATAARFRRVARPLHALSRPARRRPGGRQHHSLPLASRLLRSARPARRWPRRRSSPLACWQVERARRQDHRRRQERTAGAEADRRGVRAHRHRRRRRGRLCRGRDAAAARLCRRRSPCSATTSAAPVDRPNLSKDYLAGSAPEDWVPLRGDDWYAENNIDLQAQDRGRRARCRRRRS